MWRAARDLISWCYTTLGRTSSPDVISNNLNNINDLKFYHSIRGHLENVVAVRHIALNLLRQEHSHHISLRQKRLLCGLDEHYLLTVLSGAT
jgi:hypothetical protein